MVYTELTLYLYCYYGKYATDSYASYANCLYNSNWIILPLNFQKLFVVMIGHAQQPLFYHGYGMVELNLETFARVSKTGITYYLMFKTLTAQN